ncbi:hypothetical protein ACP3WT_26630, partial [Salmonella enterica]|uniref:hypothetical protein n=1 Tax=Salmonella enterica TaxID=28901 RepID=UPI003CF03A76
GEPRVASAPLHLALIIGASLLWAIANIQMKQLAAIDGFALNAYMSLFAAPQLLAVSAVLETGQIDSLRTASLWGYASLVYMA